jgi:hypothetical protein
LIRRKSGISLVEVSIAITIIAILTYFCTKLCIDYYSQFEVGQKVSTLSFNAIHFLDTLESELIQASASSIVLGIPLDSGGYRSIEFPKVTGYDIVNKVPILDISNTIKFAWEENKINKYILDKSVQPSLIKEGPIPVLDNVGNFSIVARSAYVYEISVTLTKSEENNRTLTHTYSRKVYIRNK